MSITFGVAQAQMGVPMQQQAASMFRWEGSWRNSMGERSAIRGTQVFWSTGDVENCQPTGPDSFSLGGGAYTARLTPDGNSLTWSNGLAWTREPGPAMSMMPQAMTQPAAMGMPQQQVLMPGQPQMVMAGAPQMTPQTTACAQMLQNGMPTTVQMPGMNMGQAQAAQQLQAMAAQMSAQMGSPMGFAQWGMQPGQPQQVPVPVQAMPCGGPMSCGPMAGPGPMPMSGGSCRLPVNGVMPNMSGSITMPVTGGVGGSMRLPGNGIEMPVPVVQMPDMAMGMNPMMGMQPGMMQMPDMGMGMNPMMGPGMAGMTPGQMMGTQPNMQVPVMYAQNVR